MYYIQVLYKYDTLKRMVASSLTNQVILWVSFQEAIADTRVNFNICFTGRELDPEAFMSYSPRGGGGGFAKYYPPVTFPDGTHMTPGVCKAFGGCKYLIMLATPHQVGDTHLSLAT